MWQKGEKIRQVHQARSNKRKIETRVLATLEKLLLGTFTLKSTSLEAFAEHELLMSSRGLSGEPPGSLWGASGGFSGEPPGLFFQTTGDLSGDSLRRAAEQQSTLPRPQTPPTPQTSQTYISKTKKTNF